MTLGDRQTFTRRRVAGALPELHSPFDQPGAIPPDTLSHKSCTPYVSDSPMQRKRSHHLSPHHGGHHHHQVTAIRSGSRPRPRDDHHINCHSSRSLFLFTFSEAQQHIAISTYTVWTLQQCPNGYSHHPPRFSTTGCEEHNQRVRTRDPCCWQQMLPATKLKITTSPTTIGLS